MRHFSSSAKVSAHGPSLSLSGLAGCCCSEAIVVVVEEEEGVDGFEEEDPILLCSRRIGNVR